MALLYIVLRLGRFITAERYFILFVIAFSMGYGVTAIVNQKWDSGRMLFMIQIILFCIATTGLLAITRK